MYVCVCVSSTNACLLFVSRSPFLPNLRGPVPLPTGGSDDGDGDTAFLHLPAFVLPFNKRASERRREIETENSFVALTPGKLLLVG